VFHIRIFKEWPFREKELVKILWLKSPYKNERNAWLLPVIFQSENDKIVELETSWGSLPLLRFGQYFNLGKPIKSYKEGTLKTHRIPDFSKGELIQASKIEGLTQNDYFKQEYCWVFNNGEKKFVVPCIELVRSILAPMKILANAVLEPVGLEEFINSYSIEKPNKLNIVFNKRVPYRTMSDDFARHFAWLKFNNEVHHSWTKIAIDVFPKGAVRPPEQPPLFEYGIVKPKFLTYEPPFKEQLHIATRQIEYDNYSFIFEIVAIKGLNIPFDDISYSHESSVTYEMTPTDQPERKLIKRKKVVKKQEENTLFMQNPRYISNTIISKEVPTFFGYKTDTKVLRERKVMPKPVRIEERGEGAMPKWKPKVTSKAKKHGRATKKYDETTKLFSTDDIYSDGNPLIKPVEITGLRSLQENETFIDNTLGPFLKMTKIVEELSRYRFESEHKLFTLPGSSKISYKEDGTPRQCALVTFRDYFQEINCFYLLEVERFLDMYLSTLLLWPKNQEKYLSERHIAIIMEEIMLNLVKNNGHWDKKALSKVKGVKIHRLKHLDMWTEVDWATVVIGTIDKLYFHK